jgi:hypothetical protein
VRSLGLVDPWDDYWDRAYRYELCEVAGGVRPRTDLDAVHEDRVHTATQDPHHRWRHLAMPTLLLRATQEIRPGAGFVVPPSERDRFVRAVPHAKITKVDATHVTITTHQTTATATRNFLRTTL